jgi:undecaprenyl-diphosphatase
MPLAAIAFVTLGAALALTIAVATEGLLSGDERILRDVQTWDALGGRFADAIRFFTTTQVVLATGAAAVVALWLLDERRAAVTLAIALVLLAVAQPALKEIVDRPRPAEPAFDVRASATSESFPAGHVMSPTVLYGYIAFLAFARVAWPSALRIVLVAITISVLIATALANLYLGVHWPTDVLGGYLWGAAVILAATLIEQPLWRPPRI